MDSESGRASPDCAPKTPRRRHTAEFNAAVAGTALTGRQPLANAPRVAPAPHIFRSDQGSQLTSLAHEQALLAAGGRTSRAGRGRATDNAFIERLRRTVQWGHSYPNPANDGHHLHRQLHACFAHDNHRRPRQSLHGQTPAQVFTQTATFTHNHVT